MSRTITKSPLLQGCCLVSNTSLCEQSMFPMEHHDTEIFIPLTSPQYLVYSLNVLEIVSSKYLLEHSWVDMSALDSSKQLYLWQSSVVSECSPLWHSPPLSGMWPELEVLSPNMIHGTLCLITLHTSTMYPEFYWNIIPLKIRCLSWPGQGISGTFLSYVTLEHYLSMTLCP